MASPDPETVELRWTRPDGEEAVAVVMIYATAEEASMATERALHALEEDRHARARSRLAVGGEKVEP